MRPDSLGSRKSARKPVFFSLHAPQKFTVNKTAVLNSRYISSERTFFVYKLELER
jgi:hypothetical protein